MATRRKPVDLVKTRQPQRGNDDRLFGWKPNRFLQSAVVIVAMAKRDARVSRDSDLKSGQNSAYPHRIIDASSPAAFKAILFIKTIYCVICVVRCTDAEAPQKTRSSFEFNTLILYVFYVLSASQERKHLGGRLKRL
jgi:hypothetical protein